MSARRTQNREYTYPSPDHINNIGRRGVVCRLDCINNLCTGRLEHFVQFKCGGMLRVSQRHRQNVYICRLRF